ncbi:FAD-dependent monooxygenase [Kitasatospora herbaricolor]|uniref:FAD-dependent monooxygenase n=1 Tax=Kitasatospora herbaricolor TaxID=68217 RepID=A0ABZ1W3G9_9ACTN|nr:FAD-dependent monooxygenase [Kitasatospora herbaricolor]
MLGGTVAVVGGSIAGCAFAAAAARGGARRVVVLERSYGELTDRGVGLCVHDDRYDELAAAGHLDEGIAWHRLTRRHWLVADGSALGRLVWDQPFPFRSYHWGLLWRGLRERTPATVEHRLGDPVAGVRNTSGAADGPPGAVVRLLSGGEEHFDLVVGADGYRSVVRAAVCPEARPGYAGYVCWRGSFPAGRLAALDHLAGPADRAWPAEHAATVCFPGGQCVLYRIPGQEPGRPMVNWVFYAPPPAAGLRLEDPTSIPPGAATEELTAHVALLAERHLPPYWAALIALTPSERTFLQPIYDLDTPRRTSGRLLLAGDAATVVRPHNTSGAAKAIQDAVAFEDAWRRAASWEELIAAYERDRGEAGRALVTLGRRLGRAQVEQAPDWTTMDPVRTAAWWDEQLAGTAGFGGHAFRSAVAPVAGPTAS